MERKSALQSVTMYGIVFAYVNAVIAIGWPSSGDQWAQQIAALATAGITLFGRWRKGDLFLRSDE